MDSGVLHTVYSFAIHGARNEEEFLPSLREPILVATIQTNPNFDNHPESLRLVFESGVDLDSDDAASRQERRTFIICESILIAMGPTLLWLLLW